MFNYYAGVFASLGLVLTAVSPELFAFLLPDEYHWGYVVIPWLIGSAVLHRSATLTRLGMMVSEKTVGMSVASAIGTILNVVIALFLIQAFGVAGAAIGSFVAELVFTSLSWWFSTRTSDVRFDTRAILVVLLSYIVCSILLLVVAEMVAGPMSIIYRVGLVLVTIGLIGYQIIDESVLRFLGLLSRRFRLTFERLSHP
jgi:O-antigen/teichoic acid export membrane protein